MAIITYISIYIVLFVWIPVLYFYYKKYVVYFQCYVIIYYGFILSLFNTYLLLVIYIIMLKNKRQLMPLLYYLLYMV